MFHKDIPAGYQLQVVTWENDADDYKTSTLNGLTEEDVKFYIALAKEFTSRHHPKNGGGLGNYTLNKKEFKKRLQNHLANFPNISENVKARWESALDFDEYCDDLYSTILEEPCQMGETFDNFVRVYDRHNVYFISEAIQNVTQKF